MAEKTVDPGDNIEATADVDDDWVELIDHDEGANVCVTLAQSDRFCEVLAASGGRVNKGSTGTPTEPW